MAFQQTLENLRSKPPHIRSRIAFWSSFGITAVIFMFWLATFSVTGKQNAVVASKVDKVGTPGQSLIAGVGNFFVDIKDMIFGAKKIQYAEVEVSAGRK